MRIIKRAGHLPWPKLFHNLRASRESELMREFDLATVCKWIGNSPEVAARHYAVSCDLDGDFQRAAGKAREIRRVTECNRVKWSASRKVTTQKPSETTVDFDPYP